MSRTPMLATAIVAATVAVLVAHSAAAQTAEPNLGRNLASSCANCHGTNGNSRGRTASLAGAAKDGMVQKFKDFQAGKSPSTIMQQIAKGYTDQQIDLIAGYFAAQSPVTPAAATGAKY